jgi:hypothetical protein
VFDGQPAAGPDLGFASGRHGYGNPGGDKHTASHRDDYFFVNSGIEIGSGRAGRLIMGQRQVIGMQALDSYLHYMYGNSLLESPSSSPEILHFVQNDTQRCLE